MKPYLKPIIVYLVVCFLLFPQIFLGTKSFIVGDTFSLMVPGRIFLVDQLRLGVLPFWNPLIYSGIPFLADISQSIFYPTTLLFIFFSPATAINLSIVIHCIISAIGIYAVCRRLYKKNGSWALISGVIWLISQPIVLTVNNNLSALQSLTWLPWMIVVAIKSTTNSRFLLWLPGIIALSFFGGHPQPMIMSIGLSFLIYLIFGDKHVFRRFFDCLLVGVASILLTLFILIPVAEYSAQSTRSQLNNTESLNLWSTHPLHLLDALIPNLFLNPRYGMIWGINWNLPPKGGIFTTYFGIATIGLLIWHWKKISKFHGFFLITGLGFVLLSLGKYLPGFSFVYTHAPFVSWFRNIPLMSYGYILSVAVLLPQGITLLQQSVSSRFRKIVGGFSLLAFFATALLLFTFPNWFVVIGKELLISPKTFHTYPRDYIICFNVLTSLSLSFGCFGLGLLFLSKRFSTIMVGGLIAINLWFVNAPYTVLGPRTLYERSNALLDALPHEIQYRALSAQDYMPYVGMSNYWSNMWIAPPFGETQFTSTEQQTFTALIQKRNTLAPNWNMVYNRPSTNGYATFLPLVVAQYWKQSADHSNVNTIDYGGFSDQRLNDQGVHYFITDKLVFRDRHIPNELGNFPIVKETNEWAVLKNPQALPIVRYATYPQGSISVLPGTVNDITFEAENASDSAILVKVTPYPGWKCIMDGTPCPIQVDGLGMKLMAPAGKHSYRLSFTPTGWPYITWISAISWLCYIGILSTISVWKKQPSRLLSSPKMLKTHSKKRSNR